MKINILAILFSCCAYVATAQITVYDVNQTAPGKTSDPHFLTPFNNMLYFIATDSTHGYELWGIDSINGEFLVADINPGPAGIIPGKKYNGNNYHYITEHMAVQYVNELKKDILFFTADDGVHGNELYMYDGTNPPVMAKEIVPGSQGLGLIRNMTAGGGFVFFYEMSVGIWQYDVNTGNVKMLPLTDKLGVYYDLVFYKGCLYSSVGRTVPSSVSLLWKYNPITGDTISLKSNNIQEINVLNNRLYFWSNGMLCEYDAINPVKVIDTSISLLSSDGKSIGAFNSKIYYVRPGNLIYEYDPVTKQKKLALKINDYWIGYSVGGINQMGNKMYFSAHDSLIGRELYEWDGVNPPKLAADIRVGSYGSSPYFFHVFSHGLYFVATSSEQFGPEVHRYKPFPATIQNISFKGEVRAYPNPVTSTTTIELQLHTAQTLSVELFNTEGKKLLSLPQVLYSQGTGRVELDMRNLPAGNYFYHVRNRDNKSMVSGKLVKL
jgi:ELWxxDGT repeat protein